MKTILMNTENIKTNEPRTFVLTLMKILDLRISKKHVGLQNLTIYYTCKNIIQQYKNIKVKLITSTWNDEF